MFVIRDRDKWYGPFKSFAEGEWYGPSKAFAEGVGTTEKGVLEKVPVSSNSGRKFEVYDPEKHVRTYKVTVELTEAQLKYHSKRAIPDPREDFVFPTGGYAKLNIAAKEVLKDV